MTTQWPCIMPDWHRTDAAGECEEPVCEPGKDIDFQCGRCGSSVDTHHCEICGGEGVDGHDCGEDSCCCLHPEENLRCDVCEGTGFWRVCMSPEAWCEANPLPGREAVRRGSIESFEVHR